MLVEECIPKYKLFSCECGNTNEDNLYYNEIQGMCICVQCGKVLQTSVFYKESPTTSIDYKTNKLYSTQAQYMPMGKKIISTVD